MRRWRAFDWLVVICRLGHPSVRRERDMLTPRLRRGTALRDADRRDLGDEPGAAAVVLAPITTHGSRPWCEVPEDARG